MARIFLGLAVVAISLMLCSVGAGYWIDDFSGAVDRYRQADRAVQRLERNEADPRGAEMVAARQARAESSLVLDHAKNQRTFHTLLGIASAMVAVLVSSITVTYFVGTSRWCLEVVDAYALDDSFVRRSRALKRGAFPWALSGMLAVLLIALSGPFADPASSAHVWFRSTSLADWPMSSWVSVHAWVSILGTLFLAYSFFRQLDKIAANYQVIDDVMARVDQVRRDREASPTRE